MPPKKSATAAPASSLKTKATNRKADAKGSSNVKNQEDKVVEKNLKEKPKDTKRGRTKDEEKKVIKKEKKISTKEKAPVEAEGNIALNNDEEKKVIKKEKKISKKEKAPVEAEGNTALNIDNTYDNSSKKKSEANDIYNEDQNGHTVKKETKPKKKKTKQETNKAQPEDINVEDSAKATDTEESGTKKGRKRKAAPKTENKDEPVNKTTRMNATQTKWENINFKCTSKNSYGKAPNFHITSWNVDGLRAWLKKGGLDIIHYDQPDIFCIQETKCTVDKIPDEIKNLESYETLWCNSEKEGYAGVGIATKIKPLKVTYGINSEEHDKEGRCITAEYEKFFLINVYVPNAGRKLITLPKRLEWNKLFKEYVKKLDKRKPVIVCGDMNVAHTEIDLANPKTNTKNAGFTVEEREGMTDFLEDGYVDTFRKLYPDKEKAYTFWTYMANARSKNVGWRLDYFLVSDRLTTHVCDNLIHSEVLGSDHCPLSLHLNL